jgi:hypothetical protein
MGNEINQFDRVVWCSSSTFGYYDAINGPGGRSILPGHRANKTEKRSEAFRNIAAERATQDIPPRNQCVAIHSISSQPSYDRAWLWRRSGGWCFLSPIIGPSTCSRGSVLQ